MPEERITLKFKEKRVVWNREVVYSDYDLKNNRAFIIAGNEYSWFNYLEGKNLTSDFYVMLTRFDLISVDLLIRYGAEAPLKWQCSGPPLYVCSQSINGTYNTKEECLAAACKEPQIYGQRYCIDSKTIAVWNATRKAYDIAPCSTGECKDGYCAPPPPVGNGSGDGGDGNGEENDTSTMILAAVVIAIVIIFLFGRR